MKSLKLVGCLMALCISIQSDASGGGGSTRPIPGPNPSPTISCDAEDDGYEEHWGGHSSCQSCLAKHGGCTQTCRIYHYECTAAGTNSSGLEETFEGINDRESKARDIAIARCTGRASNCQIKKCDEESKVHSRSKCQ